MEKYFAVGLNKNLEGGRIAGNLEITPRSIKFYYNHEMIELPLSELQVSQGGAGNNLIYLSHRMYPDWNIYTSDKSILKNPIVKNTSAFHDIIRRSRNYSLIVAAWVVGLSVFLTVLVFALYGIRNSFSYAIASKIPIQWEVELGNTVLKTLLSQKKLYPEEYVKILDPITQPLSQAAKDSGYEFHFYIIEDSTLNAFALPGGNIVIHSALIQKAESPEEIAGVLAHEISHVTEKHGMRQIINTIGVFVVIQTLFGDFTGLLAVLTQNSGLLIRSKFSRDFEREADAKGFHYLVNSKIHPKGMIAFFKKILEEEKKIGINSEVLTFISTHPGTEERIEKLKEKITRIENREFIPVKMNLKKLQTLLQAK